MAHAVVPTKAAVRCTAGAKGLATLDHRAHFGVVKCKGQLTRERKELHA